MRIQPEWIESDSASLYGDIIRLSSNERHFILSFGQSAPSSNKIKIVSQVTLHPKTAGELLAILAKQIDFHEKKFGSKLVPGKLSFSEKVIQDADGNSGKG